MGFGSYDESEQENQQIDTNEDGEEAESINRQEDDTGSLDFEHPDGGADELIEQLQDIKDEEGEEDEE